MRRALLLLGLTALAVAPYLAEDLHVAHADPADKQRAIELINLGNERFQKQAYQEALHLYLQAYDRYRSPKILFNIGRAYDRSGQHAAAAAAFNRFVTESGFDDSNPLFREAKGRLDELELTMGALTVTATVSDYQYALDGEPAEITPGLAFYLEPGAHRLSVSREGFFPLQEVIDVKPGTKRTMSVRLLPIPPKPTESEDQGVAWWVWAAAAAGAVAVGVSAAALLSGGGFDPPPGEIDGGALGEWERL